MIVPQTACPDADDNFADEECLFNVQYSTALFNPFTKTPSKPHNIILSQYHTVGLRLIDSMSVLYHTVSFLLGPRTLFSSEITDLRSEERRPHKLSHPLI